jgi:hypothetical protein
MAKLGKNNKVSMMHEHCLLMLEIPRTNDKKELAAEQMLAALHGILRPKKEVRISGTMQEHISLEIVAIGQRIRFYIWTPKHLQAFVEGQVYAQYPRITPPANFIKRLFTAPSLVSRIMKLYP